jgi:hypothetical protein
VLVPGLFPVVDRLSQPFLGLVQVLHLLLEFVEALAVARSGAVRVAPVGPLLADLVRGLLAGLLDQVDLGLDDLLVRQVGLVEVVVRVADLVRGGLDRVVGIELL